VKGNTTYAVRLVTIDSDQATNSMILRFDTFDRQLPVIEVEDYNFEGGQFIDEPVLVPEGTGPQPHAYSGRSGVAGADYHDTRTAPGRSLYRPQDPVSTRHTSDFRRPKFVEAGGPADDIFDYDVHDIEAGEFLTYTRPFPEAFYEVYLREAVLNLDQADTVLERVMGLPETNQTTLTLGHFIGRNSGFEYRNVPLTDDLGNKVAVLLSGVATLRLRQLTSAPTDGAIYQNYLVFVPRGSEGAVLEFADALGGPYRPDWTAVLDRANSTISAKRSDQGSRFYRMRWDDQVKFTNVQIAGERLIFKYRVGEIDGEAAGDSSSVVYNMSDKPRKQTRSRAFLREGGPARRTSNASAPRRWRSAG
jgi:hypothetical protein